MEKAIFAAGCFWGVESVFMATPGVIETEVGYIGGHTNRPTYDDVCTGRTGHAEAVQVTFDPSKVSYEKLVEKFFALHDPTQVNRQGPDIGDQYRSAIFTLSLEQETIAKATKEKLSSRFKKPIATLIQPAQTFWRAEEYHQKWDQKHGRSCHF
ncbi:MAG: peptide-methionine (S)-S-oxide reductase MsrA [Alphaproteobacteria bacterium]